MPGKPWLKICNEEACDWLESLQILAERVKAFKLRSVKAFKVSWQ